MLSSSRNFPVPSTFIVPDLLILRFTSRHEQAQMRSSTRSLFMTHFSETTWTAQLPDACIAQEEPWRR